MIMYGPKNAVPLILATFVTFLIVSCSMVYHGVKGRVVEILNSAVYLDIRTGDGVSIGQELNVLYGYHLQPGTSSNPCF